MSKSKNESLKEMLSSPSKSLELGRLREAYHLVPEWETDDAVQRLLNGVAKEFDFPIALVSVVLNKVQFFRAQVGLPPELAATRTTDRCSSLCQFVVEKGMPLSVEDVTQQPELPRDLLNQYKIVSYFGFPLNVNGAVIGSLCLIDFRPRKLTPAQKSRMTELAKVVSENLEKKNSARSGLLPLINISTRSAFAEMRNILSALSLDLEKLTMLAADCDGVFRLLKAYLAGKISEQQLTGGLLSLQKLLRESEGLAGGLVHLGESVGRLGQLIEPLEETTQFTVNENVSDLREMLNRACELIKHHAKVIGGIHCSYAEGDLSVPFDRQTLTATMASALVMTAESIRRGKTPYLGGVFLSVGSSPEKASIKISCPALSAAEWAELAAAAAFLTHEFEGMNVSHEANGFSFHFSRKKK
jgi:hypothetical protein